MSRTITYVWRGRVERPDGRGSYRWHEGYSEDGESGGPLYPWMTKLECRKDARAQGARAVFEEKR